MSEQVVALSVRIHGRVQGVFFRACTREEARRLGVCGWVRNDEDGSVVAHLEGPEGPVEELLAWCRRGPEGARVERIEHQAAAVVGATSFEVVR